MFVHGKEVAKLPLKKTGDVLNMGKPGPPKILMRDGQWLVPEEDRPLLHDPPHAKGLAAETASFFLYNGSVRLPPSDTAMKAKKRYIQEKLQRRRNVLSS
jgi:hypothetical protein